MEHGDDDWNSSEVNLRRTSCAVLHIRRLGGLDTRHFGHDGGIVGLLAHSASSLGRVHEQVLLRSRLSVPAVLLQSYFERRRRVKASMQSIHRNVVNRALLTTNPLIENISINSITAYHILSLYLQPLNYGN